MLRPAFRAAGVVATIGLVCFASLRVAALQASTPGVGRVPRPPPSRGRAIAPRVVANPAPVVVRNIFDSKCARDRVGEPNPCAEAEVDLDVVLYGTTAATDPAWSSALIAPRSGGQPAVGYAVGDSVQPGVVLASVEPGRVELRLESGQSTWLALLEPGQGRELRRAASAGGKAVTRRKGNGEYEVSDAALAQLYEDPSGAVEKLRARERRERGRVVGVTLGRVSRSSTLGRLGLRNGDVVNSVNGQSIRSEADLARAWASLSSARSVELSYSRRNGKRSLSATVL